MRITSSHLLATLACGFAVGAHAASAYQFTDLGAGMAYGINNLDQVVGTIDVSTPPTEEFAYATHAALFSNGHVTDLGTLGGQPSSSSYATSINDAGQVVGWSYIPSTFLDPRGHVYGYTAFTYQNGQISALSSSDTASKATSINQQGQIAVTSGDISVYTDYDSRMAHVDDHGVRTPIISPAGPISVNGINNAGQTTGQYGTINTASTENMPHAYLDTNGVVKDLGTLGGATSNGSALNNLGQVTGRSDIQDGNSHAFLYSQGHMTDLGTLGGKISEGLAINDLGQVVGYSTLATTAIQTEAFLYSNGKMINLQNLMAPVIGSDWILSEATGINARGDIVGWGQFDGETHAFMLRAVPEPDVVALVLAGLVCVGFVAPRAKSARRAQACHA